MPENALESVKRIQLLRKTASTFLEKSLNCTKIGDVQAFFDLANQADANADRLEGEIKIESCWVYLHFVQECAYPVEYSSYLEFCIRNGLTPVAKKDFFCASAFLLGDKES